jgi:hypothetical protein
MAIFVDGRPEAVAVNTSESLTGPPKLAIGQCQKGGGCFAGAIDELIIFSRCISAKEVAQIHRLGTQRTSLATLLSRK